MEGRGRIWVATVPKNGLLLGRLRRPIREAMFGETVISRTLHENGAWTCRFSLRQFDVVGYSVWYSLVTN